jgi:hypothetical protein
LGIQGDASSLPTNQVEVLNFGLCCVEHKMACFKGGDPNSTDGYCYAISNFRSKNPIVCHLFTCNTPEGRRKLIKHQMIVNSELRPVGNGRDKKELCLLLASFFSDAFWWFQGTLEDTDLSISGNRLFVSWLGSLYSQTNQGFESGVFGGELVPRIWTLALTVAPAVLEQLFILCGLYHDTECLLGSRSAVMRFCEIAGMRERT